MRVHICGARGSRPATGSAFAAFGGDTSCVAIAHDDDSLVRLILDAGTGLRHVDQLLAGRPFRGTILLGHLHWDHTYGIPFFRSADHPESCTHLLVPAQEVPAEALIDRFMSPPTFPVRVSELEGDWRVGSIESGHQQIEGFEVLARDIPHKGGRTFGYRISDGSSSLAYLSDHGPRGELGEGPDGWGPYHDEALELCESVDLLVHDAQHTPAELAEQFSLGHSAADYAVELARRSGARRVLLFHHDPDRTDDGVRAIADRFSIGTSPSVAAAYQGLVLSLP